MPRRDRPASKNLVGENLDDAFREVDELLERWKNRFSVKNLAIAKRYVEDEFEFGVVLDPIRCKTPIGHQFIAVFKREFPIQGWADVHGLRWEMVKASSFDIEAMTELRVSRRHWDQEAMLVADVDLVQTPKEVVRSFVRFEPLHQGQRIGRGTLETGGDITAHVGSRPTYWELSVVSGCRACVDDECVRQQVKGRPEIVDAVSDNGAPLDRNRLSLHEVVRFVLGLRIFLDDRSVWLSRFESVDGRIKISKMFFGPVNLSPNTKQKVRHGKAP